MKKSLILPFVSLMATFPLGAVANSQPTSSNGCDIQINHLSPSNTLVRVKGEGKYLLMPVQESIEDAQVNLLVDGNLERTFYVRLAKSKVDYTVPLDLEPYKGKDVVLEVIYPQNGPTIHEARNDAAWNNFTIANSFDVQNHEKYRPLFHHTPEYGWMNDPNGMFYKDGVWHLYYQWNPYGSKWQNMTWGHSSSTDLVHWNHHPAAIEPNGLGTVFSGSSALDPGNTAGFGPDAVVALYTSAGTSQTQSLAWSTDNGETFNIYPGNPIITMESEARDPNMFFNSKTGKWNMVLAHPLDHEVIIFSSPDLKNWTQESVFGEGMGAIDGIWECPDLFELPVQGTDMKKWMLIVNLNPGGPFGGSGIQYFIGDFDGKAFKPDRLPDGTVPTKWLDFGKDNYALVSWSDAPQGRRTAIGWMSNWQYADQVPTMQFRSANTLPREIALFKGPDGQIYASSAVSPEVDKLRSKLLVDVKKTSFGKKAGSFVLTHDENVGCEIDMNLQAKTDAPVKFIISNDKDEKITMTYNPVKSEFSVDRTESGITDFSVDFPCVTTAPTFEKDGSLSLRIYLDKSSIEVFGNDGKFVITDLVFPTDPYNSLAISSEGKVIVTALKIYEIK